MTESTSVHSIASLPAKAQPLAGQAARLQPSDVASPIHTVKSLAGKAAGVANLPDLAHMCSSASSIASLPDPVAGQAARSLPSSIASLPDLAHMCSSAYARGGCARDKCTACPVEDSTSIASDDVPSLCPSTASDAFSVQEADVLDSPLSPGLKALAPGSVTAKRGVPRLPDHARLRPQLAMCRYRPAHG